MFIAASVFALAETATPESVPADAAKPAVCEKGKPQCRKSPKEMHKLFVRGMLLSLNDEQLDELAKQVAEVRGMTPEEKAEARKALPKPKMPKMKMGPGKCFKGKPGIKCGPRGKDFRPGKRGPHCGPRGKDFRPGKHRGPHGKDFRPGKPGPRCCPHGKPCKGLPTPPPPAQPKAE